MQNSFLKKNPF